MPGAHWWIRKWAAIQGTSAAVTCDEETLTWRELDRRIDVFARHLDSLDVGAGDRVGCLMPSCIEFLVTLYAASRVGAIFVPLNIRYTARELQFAVRGRTGTGNPLPGGTATASCSSRPAAPERRVPSCTPRLHSCGHRWTRY